MASKTLPAKRKAQHELDGPVAKAPRRIPTNATPRSQDPVKPANLKDGTSEKRPIDSPKRLVSVANGSSRSGLAKRPSQSISADGADRPTENAPRAPPKKGSYLEILERAQKAQATMGQVGKIQHKPLEKGPSKRERIMMKAEQARGAKKGTRAPGVRSASTGTVRIGVGGTDRLAQDQGRRANGSAMGKRTLESSRQLGAKGSKDMEESEKKPKKAALATTGYQGTARPRPGATTVKSGQPSVSGPANGSRAAPRRLPFERSRRSQYGDYDDELDDFIEYDEPEEDGYGHGGKRQRGYVTEEEESDMEAALSDIDKEERQADYYARKEDEEQEKLEMARKRAKEGRKQELLRAGNARSARR